MLGSLLNSSNEDFHEINSYSDALFQEFFQTISLEENDDLIDVYPFTPCKTQKFIKKVIFETFNTIKRSLDSSRNLDYDLIDNNNIFTKEFERDNYL